MDLFVKGTIGAGDSFYSSVLDRAHNNKSLLEFIELSISCAACSLSEVGATDVVSTAKETVELYKKMKEL